MTEMMQNFDALERFNSLVSIRAWEVGKAPTKEQMEEFFKVESDDFRTVLVAVYGNEIIDIIDDKSVKVFSFGDTWITKKDFIKTLTRPSQRNSGR